MIRIRSVPNSLKLSLVALFLAAVYLTWSVANAVNTPAVQAATSQMPSTFVTLQESTGPRPEIQAAVDKDLFSPTRTRPTNRYRLPGDVEAVPTTPQRQPLRWVGIILDTENPSLSRLSVAIGNNQTSPATLMKVGDKIGDYTLKSFDYKTATFQAPGGDLIVITNPRKGIN
jgi:hypothetical protein